MRKILTTALFAVACSAMFAQTNELTAVANTISEDGDVEIVVSLTNPEDFNLINAFNFDFVIPAGLEKYSDDASEHISYSDRTSKTVRGNQQATWNFSGNFNGNVLSVAAVPQAAANFLGAGEGGIVTLYFTSTQTYENETMYLNSVTISNNGVVVPTRFAIGKVGTGGYSSYSAEQNHIQIEGATAYYGVMQENSISLVEATDNIVFQNNGAILKGTDGDAIYGISVNGSVATAPTNNDLKDAPRGAVVEANSVHVLSTVNGVTGFYTYTGTHVPAGKAYIANQPSGAPIRIISDTTALESVEESAISTPAYDIMGRIVAKDFKGIVIENGKKNVRF